MGRDSGIGVSPWDCIGRKDTFRSSFSMRAQELGFPQLRLCGEARSARGRLIKHEGRDDRGPSWRGLGLKSSNGRERSSHHSSDSVSHPRPILPLLPLSPLSLSPIIFNNARRCHSPGFLLTHDENHKAWSSFFKSTFFAFLPFLPSPSLTHSGHPRPLCNSRCFSSTYNTQAILSVLPEFLLHVRLLIPLPPIYSKFSLPYSFSLFPR
jgi:hypothetical protein